MNCHKLLILRTDVSNSHYRNRWLFGILTVASFLTFQTLLAGGRKISLALFLSGLLSVFDHDSGDSQGILMFDRLCALF
jgi:hypothetical protein